MAGTESKRASAKYQALAELYETHFERVARYIAVRIGNTTEAEDLASEVYARALRALEGYRDTGAPMEAWLYRIAHNIVVDHLRARSRRPSHHPLEDAHRVSNGDDPDEPLQREFEAQQLYRAMEGLSEAQRQVLALRFGSEMTSEQAAEVMGKSPGAVREMQSAALKKLRKALADAQQ